MLKKFVILLILLVIVLLEQYNLNTVKHKLLYEMIKRIYIFVLE